MRVLDRNNKELTDYDLSKGVLVPRIIRHEDGTTERVNVFLPRPDGNEPSERAKKRLAISRLKKQLTDTDYKVIKCYEYQLAGLEVPYDAAQLHEERQAIRDQINQLETEE